MTKADLVDRVTALGDLTRRDGEIIVDTLFESVIGALKAGDKIEIRGFGSFRTRQRNSRIGRNPKTGERVDVPAKRVPFFKPSKELRDSVNPGGAKTIAKESGDGVIVNNIAANHLWPEASAVGKRICVDCSPENPNNWKRVVGVVTSIRHAA